MDARRRSSVIAASVVICGAIIAFKVSSAISAREQARKHEQEAIIQDERYALLSESGEFTVSRTSKQRASVSDAGVLRLEAHDLDAEQRRFPYTLTAFFELGVSVDLMTHEFMPMRHEFTPRLSFTVIFESDEPAREEKPGAFSSSFGRNDGLHLEKLTGLSPEGEYFFRKDFSPTDLAWTDSTLGEITWSDFFLDIFRDGPKYDLSRFETVELLARLLQGEEVRLRLYTNEGDWNLSIQYDDMNTIAKWQRMIDWVRSLGYESIWPSTYELEGV